jgi:hypothetical protein
MHRHARSQAHFPYLLQGHQGGFRPKCSGSQHVVSVLILGSALEPALGKSGEGVVGKLAESIRTTHLERSFVLYHCFEPRSRPLHGPSMTKPCIESAHHDLCFSGLFLLVEYGFKLWCYSSEPLIASSEAPLF